MRECACDACVRVYVCMYDYHFAVSIETLARVRMHAQVRVSLRANMHTFVEFTSRRSCKRPNTCIGSVCGNEKLVPSSREAEMRSFKEDGKYLKRRKKENSAKKRYVYTITFSQRNAHRHTQNTYTHSSTAQAHKQTPRKHSHNHK